MMLSLIARWTAVVVTLGSAIRQPAWRLLNGKLSSVYWAGLVSYFRCAVNTGAGLSLICLVMLGSNFMLGFAMMAYAICSDEPQGSDLPSGREMKATKHAYAGPLDGSVQKVDIEAPASKKQDDSSGHHGLVLPKDLTTQVTSNMHIGLHHSLPEPVQDLIYADVVKTLSGGVDPSLHSTLERVIKKSQSLVVHRNGFLLSGFSGGMECGHVTALHNLTGPACEAGPLKHGEKFPVFIAGTPYEAKVIRTVEPVAIANTGLKDAAIFMSERPLATANENPVAKDMPSTGMLLQQAQRIVAAPGKRLEVRSGPSNVSLDSTFYVHDKGSNSARGASGSPGILTGAQNQSVMTTHIGRDPQGHGVVMAVHGDTTPHVVLTKSGNTSKVIDHLVETIAMARPSLLESCLNKPLRVKPAADELNSY
eukprot:3864432-Amphidinium_carterae.1